MAGGDAALLGMVAAHLKDAEMVNTLLEVLAKNHYYPTFASSHDKGPEIFNADCSGGIPALMMEALAQSSPVTDKDGKIVSFNITLLPALPDCMASGSVKGLRLRGGYSLDMKWQNRVDGIGYQSALAVSGDLLNWKHLGMVLKRLNQKGKWDSTTQYGPGGPATGRRTAMSTGSSAWRVRSRSKHNRPPLGNQGDGVYFSSRHEPVNSFV
jgi:hypothetical protein